MQAAIVVRAEHVPDRGPGVIVVSAVLLSLSALAVVTRFFRRLFMSGGGVGVDDILIGFALVCDPRGHGYVGLITCC